VVAKSEARLRGDKNAIRRGFTVRGFVVSHSPPPATSFIRAIFVIVLVLFIFLSRYFAFDELCNGRG